MVRIAAIAAVAGFGLAMLDGSDAHAAAAYRATDISRRLYASSQATPIDLNDAGQVVVEERNNNYRGFIAQRLFTPGVPNGTAGEIRLLDDVVDEPPIQMPAGPVGRTRLTTMTDGGRILYGGGFRGSGLFEPTSGSTLRVGRFGRAFNDARLVALGDAGASATSLGIYEIGTTDAAPLGRLVTSIDFGDDGSGLAAQPFAAAMNAGGTVVGTYRTRDGNRETSRTFRWAPDLTGQTGGTFERLGFVYPRHVDDEAQFLNDAGAAIVNVMNAATGSWMSTLYAPGGVATDLNALFGAPSVEVLDFDDNGRVLAQLAAAGGTDRRTALYDPATFDATVGLLAFDDGAAVASLGPDALSFRPTEMNNLGQLAGLATYQRVDGLGNATIETSAVLLTPVPEPAALAGLAGVAVALACRRRPGSRYSNQL